MEEGQKRKEALEKKIKEVRIRLEQLVKEKGLKLDDHDVVQVSKELDGLVQIYMQKQLSNKW